MVNTRDLNVICTRTYTHRRNKCDLEREETQGIREKCMREGMATQNTQNKKPFPHSMPGLLDSSRKTGSILVTNDANHEVVLPKGVIVGVVRSSVEILGDPPSVESEGIPFDSCSVADLSHLSEGLQSQVGELLSRFRQVFSTSDSDIGRMNVPPHKIELYDSTPIYQSPRRFPSPISAEIEKQCRGLQELGIIEESASPWSSPVVPIRKKDGSIRLCVDYRQLN
jgi:hypothetical protein